MLVTFTCDAHENITMFGDVAVRLLKMMGQSGRVPSAILAESVPTALSMLKSALEQEKKNSSSLPPKKTSEYDEDDKDEVSLDHRAIPLISLLQSAVKEKCDVLWE